MDTVTRETETERQARLRRESEIIAQGHAEIDAGQFVEDDELEAWLDQVERGEKPPLPLRGGPASRF